MRCSAPGKGCAHHLGKPAQDPPASRSVKGLSLAASAMLSKKPGEHSTTRTTGAIVMPGLRRTPSSLHDERIVGRVKSFTHAS